MTNEEIIKETRNLADKHKYDSVLTFGINYHMAFTDISNHIEKQAEENTKLKAEIKQLHNELKWIYEKRDICLKEIDRLKYVEKVNVRVMNLNYRQYKEIEQLKAEIKKAMPFEFGQKLYSIEKWEDTGDSTIFEYEFDGVEAAGIRLVYQGNKEDVCVFSLDEIGVNIFESMDEAQKVLKGGAD